MQDIFFSGVLQRKALDVNGYGSPDTKGTVLSMVVDRVVVVNIVEQEAVSAGWPSMESFGK